MYKTVLHPTDFSDDANAALLHAVQIAELSKGRIHLLHVFQFPAIAASGYGRVAGEPREWLAEIKSAASQQLAEVEKRASESGVAVSTELLEGQPSEQIVACAEREDADMIVMGTRGTTGIKTVFVGSVAERTLRHAPCPVLTAKVSED